MSKEEETVADNDSIDKEFQIKKKEVRISSLYMIDLIIRYLFS